MSHAPRNHSRQRLDTLMVDRGLAPSRERAKQLILAGEVIVEGKSHVKPGHLLPTDTIVKVKQPLKYVSRGGLKLEKALLTFEVDVSNRVVIDVGASTGGFTDCLLQRGAKRVYAVDVGYGQLAWSLRDHPRVCVIERTNIRTIDVNRFDEPIDIGVIDVSFISLRKVLPVVFQIVKVEGDIIALIKPQFEAGRKQVGKGGVVRDPHTHVQVLNNIIAFVQTTDRCISGLSHSPIQGPAGNVEYLMLLTSDSDVDADQWKNRATQVVQQAHAEFS